MNDLFFEMSPIETTSVSENKMPSRLCYHNKSEHLSQTGLITTISSIIFLLRNLSQGTISIFLR